MSALLAGLPLALVVIAMVAWRWRAATAGALGLATALLIALDTASMWLGAFLEAAFTSATILWIVYPALCLYELQERSKSLETLRRALSALSADRRVAALLVAWFFALFMEGVAGFGTPVALAAPMLAGLGFPPLQAVALALIGHAAGVSFGALGTPVLPQVAATALAPADIARASGLLHASLGWILAAFVLCLAERGWPSARQWVLAGAAAAAFLVPYYLLAAYLGPELPTLGGALAGGAAFAFALRHGETAGAIRPRALLHATLPYLLLLALVLATRLVAPLQEALRAAAWQWSYPGGFGGRIEPLYHPGTLLLLAFVLGGAAQRRPGRDLAAAAGSAARRLLPVAVALLVMLALSRIMVHAGMIHALAAAAAATGAAWPFVAPFVGMLGTFVTGSATASNILFAGFQDSTAAKLELRADIMQGAQSFGAAVGNVVCPHNVIAGAATVGLVGREGDVLRSTVPAALLYAAAGGVLVLYLA